MLQLLTLVCFHVVQCNFAGFHIQNQADSVMFLNKKTSLKILPSNKLGHNSRWVGALLA